MTPYNNKISKKWQNDDNLMLSCSQKHSSSHYLWCLCGVSKAGKLCPKPKAFSSLFWPAVLVVGQNWNQQRHLWEFPSKILPFFIWSSFGGKWFCNMILVRWLWLTRSGNHEKGEIISFPILLLMTSSEHQNHIAGDLEIADVDFRERTSLY